MSRPPMGVTPEVLEAVQGANLRKGPGGISRKRLAEKWGLTVQEVIRLRSASGREVERG